MKIITVTALFSLLLSANCTQAERIFADSRDESSIYKRVALIKEAKKMCELPQIAIEMERLKIEHLLKVNQLERVEMMLHKLMSDIDTKDNLSYNFRFNSKRAVMKLFKTFYTKQKNRASKKSFGGSRIKNLDKKLLKLNQKFKSNSLKSLEDVGGLYHSNLKFLKSSYKISNLQEAKGLKRKMSEIIHAHPTALFTITGHASSEGSKTFNTKLSKARANSFVSFIGKYSKNIKTFHKGESFLLCYDGLLPEKNEHGESRCINGEDKKASRRVEVRRVR